MIKYLIRSVLFTGMIINMSLLKAQTWKVVGDCAYGSAVLDKNLEYVHEFQLVIRDKRAVDYLTSSGANTPNSRGEIVVTLYQNSHNYWSRQFYRSHEYVVERSYDHLIYKVYEGSISPNGKWMRERLFTDWTFRDCRFYF